MTTSAEYSLSPEVAGDFGEENAQVEEA